MNYVFVIEVERFANDFDSTKKKICFSKLTDGLLVAKGTNLYIGSTEGKVKNSYLVFGEDVVVTVAEFVCLHEPDDQFQKITDQLIRNGFIQLN